jgi:hypothetical protein
MTEREIRGLFTLLELSLNQTIDGLRATLNTIDQYKRGEVRLPELQEKLANAKDFPDFETEDGFRDPQTHVIDDIVYDGNTPNAYLEKFAIGLKKGDKI